MRPLARHFRVAACGVADGGDPIRMREPVAVDDDRGDKTVNELADRCVGIAGRGPLRGRGRLRVGTRAKGTDVARTASDADIVILAVPFYSVEAALKEARDLTGKTLVDITNPITPDYMSLTIGHTTSAAEAVAKLAPGAHVVKALSTVFWQILPFDVRRGKTAVQVRLADAE